MKWFIRLVVGLAVLLVAILGMLSLESVQRRLVVRTLSTDKNQVQLDKVHVGLGRIELSGLHLQEESFDVKVDTVDIDWSLITSLRKRAFVSDRVVVKELLLAFKKPPSLKRDKVATHQKETKIPLGKFKGLLSYLQGIQKIQIANLDIEGKLNCSEGKAGQFSIKGNNIVPKEDGQIKFALDFVDASPNTVVDTLVGRGELAVKQQAGPLEAMSFSATLDATGASLSAGTHLTLDASVKQATRGEEYALNFASLDEWGQSVPLVVLEAFFAPKSRIVEGQFDASVNNEQLALLAAAIPMPVFQLTSKGEYSFDIVQDQGQGQFSCKLDAHDLGRVSPKLAGVESIAFVSDLDMSVVASALAVNSFGSSLRLGKNYDKGAFACNLLQPFKFQLEPFTIQAKGRLLSVMVDGLDVGALLQGTDVELTSEPLSARCFLAVGNDSELSLTGVSPLRLNNIDLAFQGEPLLSGVDMDLGAAGSYQGNIGILDVRPLILEKAGEKLATLVMKVQFGQAKEDKVVVSGELITDFKRLCQQPFIKGRLRGEFEREFIVDSTFEGAYNRDAVVSLSNLALTGTILEEAAQESVLNVNLLQPLTFTLMPESTGLPQLSVKEDPFLKFTFNNFPLDVLSPFVHDYDFGGVFRQGALSISQRKKGIFSTHGKIHGFLVEATQPLKLENVRLQEGTQPLLDNLHVSVEPNIFWADKLMELKCNAVTLGNRIDGTSPFVKGNVEAVLDLEQALPLSYYAVDFTVSLDGLLKQPAFVATHGKIDRGNLSVVGRGDFASKGTGETYLKIASKDIGGPEIVYLSEMTAELTGTLPPGGEGSFELPIVMKGRHGTSDLHVKGELIGPQDERRINITVSGKKVIVDDALLLVEACRKAGGKQKSGVSATDYGGAPLKGKQPLQTQTIEPQLVHPDVQPFWAGFAGKALLDIDKMVYKQYQLEAIQGHFEAHPYRLVLEKLGCRLAGAHFNVNGDIIYIKKDPMPYHLLGDMMLQEFDVGDFLRKVSPSELAAAEGIFSIKGKVHGAAPNMDVLIDQSQGTFSLEGKRGLIRALGQLDNKTKAITGIVGIIGAVTGSQVRELEVVNEALNYFREIPYDTLSIQAKREAELNIDLTQIVLQSPDIYIEGKGTLFYDALTPIHEQRLEMKARLDTQGRAASILNQLGLVRQTQTPKGYYVGPEFVIMGTPSKPDFSNLNDIIQQAGAGLLGGRKEPLPGESETKKEDDLSKAIENIFGLFGK